MSILGDWNCYTSSGHILMSRAQAGTGSEKIDIGRCIGIGSEKM